MKKIRIAASVSVLLVMAAFSAILFLVKKSFCAADWIVYGGTMLALFLLGLRLLEFSKKRTQVVYDPLLDSTGAVFAGVHLIIGSVCLCFPVLPLIPMVIFEIVFYLIYAVVMSVLLSARSNGSQNRGVVSDALMKLRLLEQDIQAMADNEKNPERKQALEKLAEAAHFSDVSTHPGLSDVDARISESIARLQADLAAQDADPMERIHTLTALLKERNRTAAILRQKDGYSE